MSFILLLLVFPIHGAMYTLEWFFHRLNVLLEGDLAGASLVKWIFGSRGRVEWMEEWLLKYSSLYLLK